MSGTEYKDRGVAERFSEADFLKAIGIVAVVLIHSTRAKWDPGHSIGEFRIKEFLRFAVPAFLFASGFLYAHTDREAWTATLRRLRRILLPYLVAALCAEVFWSIWGQERDLETIVRNLLLGSSFGQYYFVFVLTMWVLLTPVVARMPRRLLWALFIVGVIAQGLHEAQVIGSLSFTRRIRSPIAWWPYFCAGWLFRLYHAEWAPRLRRYRTPASLALAVGLATCWAILIAAEQDAKPLVISWLCIWFSIVLILTLTTGRKTYAPIQWLSEATYTIYLFHLFFVVPGVQFIRAAPLALDPITIGMILCAGMLGPVTLLVGARKLLGARSRDLVGG